MKKITVSILLAGTLAGSLASCAGGSGASGGVIYRNHYGYNSWWGYPGYRDSVIVVPPDPGDREAVNLPVYPETEAPMPEQMPLPVEPDMDDDMGMPDIDAGMW